MPIWWWVVPAPRWRGTVTQSRRPATPRCLPNAAPADKIEQVPADDNPPLDPEDDDFEYEVEPIDEHVVAQEQARGRAELQRAEAAIDVDALYRELDARTDFDAALGALRPRFTLRNLLIAMTLVAAALGAWAGGLMTGSVFAALVCLSLLVLGSAHAWISYHDQRRREWILAKHEHERRRARVAQGIETDDDWNYDEPDPEPPLLDPIGELRALVRKRRRFSLSELLLLTAATAALLAIVRLTGSTGGAAALLGGLAIAGFAAQMADLAMPRRLLIAWWFSLAGFAVLTLASIALG